MRIGHGYDVHRLVENRKLVLGGVTVDYAKGLLGHSDADVLTHAVIDALIGATGKGDIGKMFPDSSAEYKDIYSLTLLERVYEMLRAENYEIVNIDCTIIAQQPKLAEYIGNMEHNLSRCLCADKNAINIKATTEEGLGFTGSGEAIAAHCVCLVKQKGESL